jgi:hypothetical protein
MMGVANKGQQRTLRNSGLELETVVEPTRDQCVRPMWLLAGKPLPVECTCFMLVHRRS